MSMKLRVALFIFLLSLLTSPGKCETNETAALQKPKSPEAKIISVCVEGNKLISTSEILKHVKTKVGDLFDRQQVFSDLRTINEMGFFDVKLLRVEPTQVSPGAIKLTFHVRENALVTSFSFEGNQVYTDALLSEYFTNQIGKPQNLVLMSESIDRLEDAYHQQGYRLARIIDVKDRADGSVRFKVEEGHIGEVRFQGFDQSEESALTRALDVHRPYIYNEHQLAKTLKDFSSRANSASITRAITPSTNASNAFILTIARNSPKAEKTFTCPSFKSALVNTIFMKVPDTPSNVVPALLLPTEIERIPHLSPYSGKF